ncbi:ribosomal protein S18-alanine N-acetyltransferase [Psychrobacter aestuarii]|uniref:[Ribosomal protein bS18]-alanine N-acetyltransferase n=1 Tax=Psychrobacter aestuarii TaxID=556327 RepID=A0ABN0VL73_9GAMM|nr:ribosomal protein S18-alanine N-acetyltransferase [Psychrobacter aestuarii]
MIKTALEVQAEQATAMIEATAAIEAVLQPEDAWDVPSINALLSQSHIHLATLSTDDGQVLAYCIYQQLFEQAEILRIGTHWDYQRQGLASQLLTAVCALCDSRDVETMLLEVRADNTPAIALYQRHGFVQIHQRKGYYQTAHSAPIDALIMQRQV